MQKINNFNKEIFLASLLYDSIEDNDINAIKVLLRDKNANPNIVLPDKGITPFHLAVGNPKEKYGEEITKEFLYYGGDPNVRSDDNMTPLHVSSAWGKFSIVKILVKNGANINLIDDEGFTPLDYAKIENHTQIINFLQQIINKNDSPFLNNCDTQLNPNYDLTLQKIIINTGNVIAEYDSKSDKNYVNTLNKILRNLPEVETTSYVQNWCITHQNYTRNDFLNETYTIPIDSQEFHDGRKKFLYFTDKYVPRKRNYGFFEKTEIYENNYEMDRTNFLKETNLESSIESQNLLNKNIDDSKDFQEKLDETFEKYCNATPGNSKTYINRAFDDRNLKIDSSVENILEQNISSINSSCSEKIKSISEVFDGSQNSIFGSNLMKISKIGNRKIQKPSENSYLVGANVLPKPFSIKSEQNVNLVKNQKSADKGENKNFKLRESTFSISDESQDILGSKRSLNIKNLSLFSKPDQNLLKKQNLGLRERTFSISDESEDVPVSKRSPKNKILSPLMNFKQNLDENKNLGLRESTFSMSDESKAEIVFEIKQSPEIKNLSPFSKKSKQNLVKNSPKKDNNKNLNLRESTFLISDDSQVIEPKFTNLSPKTKTRVPDRTFNILDSPKNNSKTSNIFPVHQKTPVPSTNLQNQTFEMHDLTKNNFSNMSSTVPPNYSSEITNDSIHDMSRISGIQTLSNISESFINPLKPIADLKYMGPIQDERVENSSETSIYESCNSSVKNQLEINIIENSTNSFEMESKNEKFEALQHVTGVPCQISEIEKSTSSDDSFLSIAEEYKYEDKDENVVLIERRLLVSPQIDIDDIKSIKSSSTVASSLPTTIDYDTDTLRNELTYRGEKPGPITTTTKRLYLKKLLKLKKQPDGENFIKPINPKRVYSFELEKTLRNPNWKDDLSQYKELESSMSQQFSQPDPTKKWREGLSKASFTYLLLDPRITQNLPTRSEKLSLEETWKIFLSSIFYVGKGKRSRPYAHLYDALSRWEKNIKDVCNKKIKHILDIWSDGHGVVCLHIFQNVIPVEAYTREAAIISAIKLQNLKNAQNGNFYGICDTWTQRQKRLLGVYLLYRAMLIFLNEGERQLRPNDI